MTLLDFTNPAGGTVWINPEMIVALREALESVDGSAKTVIVTAAGHYGVIETLDAVLGKLRT